MARLRLMADARDAAHYGRPTSMTTRPPARAEPGGLMDSTRENGTNDRKQRKSKRIRLDEVDIKLLKEVVRDSRVSQRALARAIGMSAPAVADRIARLENAGVIKGYRAELDLAALGRPMTVVVDVLSDRSTTQL